MTQIFMSDQEITHTLSLLEDHYNDISSCIRNILLSPGGVDIKHVIELAKKQQLTECAMRPLQNRLETLKYEAQPKYHRGSVVIAGVHIITEQEVKD